MEGRDSVSLTAMSVRFDRATLSPNKPPFRTDDGLLLVEANLCKGGILEYKQPNGNTIREFRPPEENERAIAEMGVLPVGIEHPSSLVNQDSAQTYRKGISLQNVRLGKGGYVAADLAIWDKELQRMIENGEKREISLGYRCDVKDEPGVWRDDSGVEHRYDRVQRNIRPNHIAVTSKARAGETVKIHMDSAIEQGEDFAVMITADDVTTSFKTDDAARIDGSCGCKDGGCDCPNCKGKGKKGVQRMEGKKMVKMSFDMGEGMSEEYEVPEETAKAMRGKMDKYRKDAEDLREAIDHLDSVVEEKDALIEELQEALANNTEVYDAVRAEKDELLEKYDSLAEELEEIREAVESLEDPEDIDERVDAEIERRFDAYEAVKHLIPSKEFDYRLDADEWAIAALEANGVDLDEDERMDSLAVSVALKAIERTSQRMDSNQSLRDRILQVERERMDSSERNDSETARQRMLAQNAEYRNKRLSEL